MSRRHQADTIAIGIDHRAWFLDALARNNQFAVAARCCSRQRLRVMVEFYDRAQRIVPVLFLPATNRQHMVEAKADILLPEPQHRLQIVRRKSDIDDVFCGLHCHTINRTTYRKRLVELRKSRSGCRVASLAYLVSSMPKRIIESICFAIVAGLSRSFLNQNSDQETAPIWKG